MSRRKVLLAWLVCGCAAGCGPSGAAHEKSVNASGVATYQGKPLPRYTITFVPVDGRRPAVGITDAQGRFSLGTNDPGDGAPPGECKVGVAWAGPPDAEPGNEQIVDNPGEIPKAPMALPAKLADPESSGVVVTVPEGGSNSLTLDLK